MKKHMKLVATVATLLIAASGIITFEACNKKNEIAKNIPELNAQELTDFDKEMILFGEKMKSAKKDGETMPLAEAIRNLTNYENFKMADATNYSADMELYTFESMIPVNDGNVYLSDLYALYQSNKTNIVNKYRSIEGEDKAIYCVSSRIESCNREGNGARIITCAYMYRSNPHYGPTNFNNTDYWSPTEGKCGPYNGQCQNSNAVIEINTKLNNILDSLHYHNNPGWDCQAGYRKVPHVTDGDLLAALEVIDPNSPNGHYGLICLEYESNCLDPDDMRYYLNSCLNIVNNFLNNNGGRDIIWLTASYTQMFLYCTVLSFDIGYYECTYVGPEL